MLEQEGYWNRDGGVCCLVWPWRVVVCVCVRARVCVQTLCPTFSCFLVCVSAVFDDGDEKTLRRSSLCLKGARHFAESEASHPVNTTTRPCLHPLSATHAHQFPLRQE